MSYKRNITRYKYKKKEVQIHQHMMDYCNGKDIDKNKLINEYKELFKHYLKMKNVVNKSKLKK